ncbi:MAG: thiamine pyrophosphate-binding protein [Nitrospirae bacterium]|nr:thiamine pyrophosphate-binding protein [Nitrospirota bacterium]
MRGCDYVAEFLHQHKSRHVFVLTGGAIAFVVDAVARRRDIELVGFQHEQAAAMAADAYSRFGEGLGTTLATSGPGATNLITGIACSFFDSIPTLHITGQVPVQESNVGTRIRQVGFQETDIVSMVKPITKYAVRVTRIDDLRYEMEKAVYLATSGRMGPALVDVPMDIQQQDFDFGSAREYVAPSARGSGEGGMTGDSMELRRQIDEALRLIAQARRPVVIGGSGVRRAKAEAEFMELVERLQFPVLVPWGALDLVPHDHPLHVAQFGIYGNRGANLAVQNCDLLLSIGSRLDTRQTGGDPKTFAREAKKIVVDIDRAELGKRLEVTHPIECDAGTFLRTMNRALSEFRVPDVTEWKSRVATYKARYPAVVRADFDEKGYVNPYVFSQQVGGLTEPGDMLVIDTGGTLVWMYQGLFVKKGVRVFTAAGHSPMGYALPAAMGACLARGHQPVLCFIGDGGLQLNIQEFQTLRNLSLPIKVFVLNNNCYGIIKQFQDSWLGSRYWASDPQGGYSSPDFRAVAAAYGIESIAISSNDEIRPKVMEALKHPGPVLVDVLIRGDQKLVPKTEFGNPIEDCSPMLPDDEFYSNMLVKPLPRKRE